MSDLWVSLLVVVIGAVLTFGTTLYFANRKLIQANHAAAVVANALRDGKIVDLEKQLGIISASVTPIAMAFQSILIKELTHYHTPELDALLARIGPPSTLSIADVERMELLLSAREHDPDVKIPASERDAARMLPMVIRRAIIEAAQKTMQPGTLVQFVSLPPDQEEHAPNHKRVRVLGDDHTLAPP
jgi:hypothetical protein